MRLARESGAGYRLSDHCTHLIRKAGYTRTTAYTGVVTLIQRFGSALNLNIHFHMLYLDGVYVDGAGSTARFRWVKAPTDDELTQLTDTIAHRIARYLERQGLLERDSENSYLASDGVEFVAMVTSASSSGLEPRRHRPHWVPSPYDAKRSITGAPESGLRILRWSMDLQDQVTGAPSLVDSHRELTPYPHSA